MLALFLWNEVSRLQPIQLLHHRLAAPIFGAPCPDYFIDNSFPARNFTHVLQH